jgi:hypothetical protein
MRTAINGLVEARARTCRAVLWLAIALALGLRAICAEAETPAVEQVQVQNDPFAARQQVWDRARNPVLPSVGPNVGRGPNENFSPPQSCESSCSVDSARCFSACPGGSALDRMSPRVAGRNPALVQCQEACLTSENRCTVSCGKLRPLPAPVSGAPTPRPGVGNALPPSPNPASRPEPLAPGNPDISPRPTKAESPSPASTSTSAGSEK